MNLQRQGPLSSPEQSATAWHSIVLTLAGEGACTVVQYLTSEQSVGACPPSRGRLMDEQ